MGLVKIDRVDVMSPSYGTSDGPGEAGWYCRQLEQGEILYFPQTPFELRGDDLAFLLSQSQTSASYHKNIAYKPSRDRITGASKRRGTELDRLRQVMRTYSRRVTEYLEAFLPRYAGSWRIDYASFRPEQEQGRNLPVRSRNDLLHIDSFPSRPTCGDRILRVFTNINPTEPRRWVTSELADVLIRRFAGTPGLPVPVDPRGSLWSRLKRSSKKLASSLGIPLVDRPPYDQFMLRLHHFLKESSEFQEQCLKEYWEFPPNSTWMVFTDMVTHAALSGQYALEQTFIVSRKAMVMPEKAPVNVLQAVIGGFRVQGQRNQ